MSNLALDMDYAPREPSGMERRRQRRKDVSLNSLTFRKPHYHASVKVVDLSIGGCRLLDHNGEFRPGEYLTFSLDGQVVVEGEVRWANENNCGIKFLAPIPQQLIDSVG
jgi:hypothetical protein